MARDRTHPESLRGQNVVAFPAHGTIAEPGAPPEPRWQELFPGREQAPLRRMARREWRNILRRLDRAHIIIAELDTDILEDYVVCRVRIRWLESNLMNSTHPTDRGEVKDPAFSPLNQYRAQLKFYIDRLGLSPRSRQDLRQARREDEEGLNLE